MSYHQTVLQDNTFPSYSFFAKTSGAMYAGVPTVDFGCEWSREDYIKDHLKFTNQGKITAKSQHIKEWERTKCSNFQMSVITLE